MSVIICGFVDNNISKPCTTSKFIKKYSNITEEIIENPDAEIFLTDFGGGIPLGRFLKEKKFRNATLYHLGDKPIINICKLTSLRGGFKTKAECQKQIEKDSTTTYKM